MTSIVAELKMWANTNAAILREKGIQLREKFPEQGSPYAWKASVEMACDGVILSYTVWERTSFQTELIVMNTVTNNTIVMDDKTPDDPRIVHSDLDLVVTRLLDNTYKTMAPDPKLIITAPGRNNRDK